MQGPLEQRHPAGEPLDRAQQRGHPDEGRGDRERGRPDDQCGRQVPSAQRERAAAGADERDGIGEDGGRPCGHVELLGTRLRARTCWGAHASERRLWHRVRSGIRRRGGREVEMIGTVVGLRGARVSSAWGSTTLIPALRGNRPSKEPLAEVWFGAHPANPSELLIEGAPHPIGSVSALEPPSVLLKLLAAASPLSIQVHPDRAQAVAGHQREEEQDIPVERRNYRDRSDKPELLLALTPMRVLCGLRSAGQSWRMLSALVPSGLDDVLGVLSKGDAALRQAIELLLRASATVTGARLTALQRGLEARSDGDEDVALARELLARFPGDAGVLVALLLRRMTLEPGEALFVAPGVIHAYLEGLGVELMAPSDNVVRGGLTGKHVDVDELLRIADLRPGGDPRVGSLAGTGPAGWRRYLAPTDAFVLEVADVDGPIMLERAGTGPSMLLCTEGRVTVRGADGSQVVLTPVRAAYLAADVVPVRLRGRGRVVHARAGRPPA
jgi:mannose-6-phosphate isomerase